VLSITYQPQGVDQANHANDITLSMVHINQVEREAIYSRDRTTYQYTRFTFDVICRYNPRATTYTGANAQEAGPLPIFFSDRTAGRTDLALRHQLMQPRGRLIIDLGGESNFFKSPLDGYTRDAHVGPVPERCDIISVHGDKTVTMHYRITTWVNECLNRRSVSPLLSHRWKRSAVTDEDHYTALMTEGEAIFRIDELARNNWSPDSFRQDLFHPVPNNCQRYGITVNAIEDGSGVTYSFVDQELPVNQPGWLTVPGLTRVEAYETVTFQTGNHILETSRLAMRTAGITANMLANLSIDPVRSAGVGIGAGIQGMIEGMRTAQAVLPRYSIHRFVRCHGNRNSTRFEMMRVAVGFVYATLPVEISNCSQNIVVTQEQHGKLVELQATFEWGWENVLLGGALPGIGQANAVNPLEVARAVFPEEGSLLPFFTRFDGPNIPPPGRTGNDGSRGTLLQMVVAQALTGSCAVPAAATLAALNQQNITGRT